jgi:pentatricopeptide repeat protein
VTLGILVKAYGQAGDCAQVLWLWDEMKEQREQANAVTFGCMIDACVKCGFMPKAVEIFQDMKRRRKHRNTILYTTLIKGYGLEKDLRSALALFREMKDERVPYNRITYNSIIDVCIKCSDVQAAENILAEMTSTISNLVPDLITYSTILKGYCRIGDLDKALQVAESINSGGLRCDELVYNTLIDGCVRANDLSAGIGLFAEMTHSGMIPSTITHSILMRLYQRSGYTEQALEAVAQLYEHHGIPRPTAGFTSYGGPGEAPAGSSANIGSSASNKGRRNGIRGGRGRTQRAAPVGVSGAAASSMGFGNMAPYYHGVPPHGLVPLQPNLLTPFLPGSIMPAPQLLSGDFQPEMPALPHGHLLQGHACNMFQQPPRMLLGPESLLLPFANMGADTTGNVPQNSYRISCVPGEAAKPPASTGVQKSSDFNAGSQVWGGA